MLKNLTVALCASALVLAGLPATAQDSKRDARKMCKQSLRIDYGAEGFRDVTVVERRGAYRVEGMAERSGREDNYFVCKVADWQIQDIRIDRWHRIRDGYSGYGADHSETMSSGEAAGVIVGALVGAAILSAASKRHKRDRHNGRDYDYRSGWNESYSPHKRITCYRSQRACYHSRKGFSAKWTLREFAN